MTDCILVTGTLGDGFRAVGPFADLEAAFHYAAAHSGRDWELMGLELPLSVNDPRVARMEALG